MDKQREDLIRSEIPAEYVTRWGLDICDVALHLMHNEVLTCQSSLVSMLIAQDGIDGFDLDSDDCSNLHPDPEHWTETVLCDYISDDLDLNVPAAPPCEEGTSNRDPDEEEEWLDELRDIIRVNAEPAEVCEWWLVTERMAEDLKAIGEVVLDNAYGYWWGRCASGQSIMLDQTMYKVAKHLQERIDSYRSK